MAKTDSDEINGISSRSLKIKSKIRLQNKTKRESVENTLCELPLEGESIHTISNGSFDYFNLIPRVIELSNHGALEFYFSTWTMSHNNVTVFGLQRKRPEANSQ